MAAAVAKSILPPVYEVTSGGDSPPLDYLTRPKKSSWATNYSNMNGGHSLILSNGVNMTFNVSFHLPQDYVC